MMRVNYEYSNIKLEHLMEYEKTILNIVNDFKNKDCKGSDFIGWYGYPLSINNSFLENIKKQAEEIVSKSEVFVVCGIGGSYLGARAVIEAIKGLKTDIEIMYLGNTFDERYIKKNLEYLKNKSFSVNVISKSGGTLETSICFRLLKNMLEDKYGNEANSRIFVTTSPDSGVLRQIAENNNYVINAIPNDIGGRYSVFTPVGLLPLAVAGVDIEKFINGAIKAHEDVKVESMQENIAYQYAGYRYKQYSLGQQIEIFATYSPYLLMVSEWWKQLFGESEGKEGKGLFPASVNFSSDLHSLGQFIQQGSKNFFMSQIKVLNKGNLKIKKDQDDQDSLNYLCDLTIGEINLRAQEGTNIAHHSGGVDVFSFEIEEVNEYTIGYLLYIYMYSCMISANLLGVNPFDQPGVELYKKEMKLLLKK